LSKAKDLEVKVLGRAGLKPCRSGPKIERALAPEAYSCSF
jgi:hypothetical protein